MNSKKFLRSKTTKTATALILAAVGFAQIPLPGSAALKDPSRSKIDTEKVTERARVDESLSERSRAKLAEASQQLNIADKDLLTFLDSQVKDRDSMRELLNELPGASRRISADEALKAEMLSDILGSYIQLRRSGLPDSFHITERDILDMHTNWTVGQKNNFARVIRRAAEIAKTPRAATLEQAFELALKENGFLEAYRRGCRA